MSTDMPARSSSPIRRGRRASLVQIPRRGISGTTAIARASALIVADMARSAAALLLRALQAGGASFARGRASLRAKAAWTRHLASEVGQGTVEYVGLLLLMATILAAIVAAASSLGGNQKIGQKVVDQIGNSIDKAGQGK